MGIGQLLGILPILCTLLESHVLCLFSSQNTNTHIEEYKIYENQNIITILINIFWNIWKKLQIFLNIRKYVYVFSNTQKFHVLATELLSYIYMSHI